MVGMLFDETEQRRKKTINRRTRAGGRKGENSPKEALSASKGELAAANCGYRQAPEKGIVDS